MHSTRELAGHPLDPRHGRGDPASREDRRGARLSASTLPRRARPAAVFSSCRGRGPVTLRSRIRPRRSDMKLNELRDNPGAARKKKRVGPRPRLGQGQDRRPRHQGPEVALGRGAERPTRAARCRSTGGCRSAASPSRTQELRRDQPRHAAEVHRRRQDRRRGRDHRGRAGRLRRWCAASSTASGCSAKGAVTAKLHDRRHRRLEVGGRGGREGRRHAHADGTVRGRGCGRVSLVRRAFGGLNRDGISSAAEPDPGPAAQSLRGAFMASAAEQMAANLSWSDLRQGQGARRAASSSPSAC